MEILRIINFSFALITLIYCLFVWRRLRLPGMMAVISWLVNLLVFWMTRVFRVDIDVTLLNIWSSSIQLHACILIVGALIIFGRQEKEK